MVFKISLRHHGAKRSLTFYWLSNINGWTTQNYGTQNYGTQNYKFNKVNELTATKLRGLSQIFHNMAITIKMFFLKYFYVIFFISV